MSYANTRPALPSHASIASHDTKTHALGVAMTCSYLADKNIEVLEDNWKGSTGTVDLICDEDGCLVFIKVVAARDNGLHGLPDDELAPNERKQFETEVITYLSSNPRPSGQVRYDSVSVLLTSDNSCFLRHHRSCA